MTSTNSASSERTRCLSIGKDYTSGASTPSLVYPKNNLLVLISEVSIPSLVCQKNSRVFYEGTTGIKESSLFQTRVVEGSRRRMIGSGIRGDPIQRLVSYSRLSM